MTNSSSVHRLLHVLGIDLLRELSDQGRVILLYQENIFGPGIVGDNDIYLSTYSSKSKTLRAILYDYNRAFVRNSTINNQFANHHIPYFREYSYPLELTDSIYNDLKNERKLNQYFRVFTNSKSEEIINQAPINLKFESNGKIFLNRDLYNVRYEGDLNSFQEYFKKVCGYEFHISDFLLNFGVSKGDLLISSDLDSEISNPINVSILKEMSFDLFNKNVTSNHQLKSFEEYILQGLNSPGRAYMDKKISYDMLLAIYKSTEEFRNHIHELSDDKNIVGEFNKLLTQDYELIEKSDKIIKFIYSKIIGKTVEYVIKTIVPPPVVDMAKEVTSLCLDAFDTFGSSKIKYGWQPKGRVIEFKDLSQKNLRK
ncbi:hypothetical protein [Sphingobacterium sp. xlx-130]|uniref:hypothetical protein n=1 Tax=Sphingobacterium sp. xlx-130 TaxID=2654323 RepID=UPI0013D9E254|nr:hypothetical protein [Sphingobacterium sp. xlx-130]